METPPSDLKLEIQSELVEILYRNLSISLLAIFFLTSMLVIELTGYVAKNYLMVWYFALTFHLCLGLILTFWYRQTKNNKTLLNYHYYLYIAGCAITALLLGMLGIIFMPTDISHQVLIIIVLIGMVGAAVQSLQSSYLACAAYLGFTLLPLLGWELWQVLQAKLIYIDLFFVTSSYLLFLLMEIYAGHRTIENNIKLKIENIFITEKLKIQNEKIEFLSNHDVLTGLYNRRYFEEILPKLNLQLGKYIRLNIFMFDIDYFKNINDHYGHESGDAVLREVGKFIQGFFYETDLCFRYGGEEFLIILEKITPQKAHDRAEQFRTALNTHRLKSKNNTITLTISGGVASFPETGETIQEIVNAADHALYEAKQKGRNQIKLFIRELLET